MLYTITEMASAYGVSLRTLRFYEQRGLLSPIREGTARGYSEKDRIRLELIIKGKKLGFSLAEIERIINRLQGASINKGSDQKSNIVNTLSSTELSQRVEQLETKRTQIEESIAYLNRHLTRASK